MFFSLLALFMSMLIYIYDFFDPMLSHSACASMMDIVFVSPVSLIVYSVGFVSMSDFILLGVK